MLSVHNALQLLQVAESAQNCCTNADIQDTVYIHFISKLKTLHFITYHLSVVLLKDNILYGTSELWMGSARANPDDIN